MMYYGYGGGWPFFGILFGIFWWVIIIALLIGLIRWLSGGRRRGRYWHDHRSEFSHSSSSALEILKERYAKGELTKEQFDSMRKDIGE